MPPPLPRVPSLITSPFAPLAIGRDVSITIFTASSLNSGEKLFLGRGNYFTFPDGPSYWCVSEFVLVFARLILRRISSASLVQVNGLGWSFQWSLQTPMAVGSSLTEGA